MEALEVGAGFWRGRRVLVTGITGFKGGWLALWLKKLGATVIGYSKPPPTTPSLFESARLAEWIEWTEGDVRDGAHLRRVVSQSEVEIVFHLAAQPLVRASYEAPVETFETNVIGTVNLLEALRGHSPTRAAVIVTTDKCYENREWCWPYRETDALGGHDPYSSSKACAEIATSAYYRSFFEPRRIGVATARAGNVIGGGDWARDRLIPDCLAALESQRSILVRNPASVRPWQHVLEPLLGYIMLAERLATDAPRFAGSWNFGPRPDAVRPVSEVVETLCAFWGGTGGAAPWHTGDRPGPHEAGTLALDASKAREHIGWRPRLNLDRALEWTVAWHKVFVGQGDVRECSLRQIDDYEKVQP
jgi:CDP-glucose 4,6-dehydratase